MYAPAWSINTGAPPAQPLRAVAPAAPIAPAGREFLATLAGRSVAALVIGRADDGHGIVEIEGRQITVAADLPAPGTRITLKFGQNPASQQASQTAAPITAALLRQAVQALPDEAGAADDGSSLVDLGDGALSLGRLAGTPLEPLQLGQVAADIEQPGQWSAALATMLRDSGTFYESHLAAWTRGNYALDQIRQEPQADAAHGASLARAIGDAGQAVVNAASPAGAAQTQAQTQAAAQAALPAQAQGVPENLQPVIREQLHALETHALPFSVEAWPGQRADMVISRDPEGQGGGRPGSTAPGWKTKLKLQLPELGNIAATLTLQGDRLWLDLSAPAASAGALDQAGAALGNAMLAAGIRLVRSRVHRDVDHAAE